MRLCSTSSIATTPSSLVVVVLLVAVAVAIVVVAPAPVRADHTAVDHTSSDDATTLVVGGDAVAGTASLIDSAWFTFAATASTWYTVSLTHAHADGDLDLELRRACDASATADVDACALVTSSSSSLSDDERIVHRSERSEMLWVHVVRFHRTGEPALQPTTSFTVAVAESACADGSCPLSAREIAVGANVSDRASIDDEHWYKFAAHAGWYYSVSLSHAHDDADLDLALLSDCAATLDSCAPVDASVSLSDDEQLATTTRSVARTLWVRIFSFDRGAADYTLVVNPTSCYWGGCLRRARTIAAATIAAADLAASGTVSTVGEEWRRFTAEANVTYTIALSLLHHAVPERDAFLHVYHSCGDTVESCVEIVDLARSIDANVERIAVTRASEQSVFLCIRGTKGPDVAFSAVIRSSSATSPTCATEGSCAARAFELVVDGGGVSEEVGEQDSDWYKISTTAGMLYRFDMFDSSPSNELTMSAFADCVDDATIDSCTDLRSPTQRDGWHVFEFVPRRNGTAFVRTYSAHGQRYRRYSISVVSMACTGDNCPSGAQSITLNTTDTAVVARDDPHWYVIDADADVEYVFDLSSEFYTPPPVVLLVFEGCADGTVTSCTMLSDSHKWTPDDSFVYTPSAATQLYAEVLHNSHRGPTVDYRFVVSATPCTASDNNCPLGATTLSAGAPAVSGVVDPSRDDHWFVMSAIIGNEYSAAVALTLSTYGLMVLFSDCGSTPTSCTTVASWNLRENTTCTWKAVAAQQMWMRIDVDDGFTVQLLESTCADDSCPGAAVLLVVDAPEVVGNASRVRGRWYTFDAIVSTKYQVTLTAHSAEIGIALLHRCVMTQVGCEQVGFGDGGNVTFVHVATETEPLWLLVEGTGNDIDEVISFTVAVTAFEATCSDCPAGASAIAVDGTPALGTASPSDEDFYQFAAVDGEVYTVALTHDHEVGDLDIILYRGCATLLQSCVPVAESVTTSDDESMRYVSRANQTLWVRVYGSGDAASASAATDYQLSVRSSAAASVECASADGTPAGACPIGVAERVAGSVAEQEEDWYVVDGAQQLDHVVAHLDFVHADGDVDLYAFHDCGATLSSCTRADASLSYDDDGHVRFVVPASGRVWLRVLGFDVQSSVDYALLVEPGANGSTTNVGLIVGLVVAALMLLAIIVVIVVVVYKRTPARRSNDNATGDGGSLEMDEQLHRGRTSTSTSEDAATGTA